MVAVFDRRVLSKAYGKQFIASLPDCTVRRENWRTLAQRRRHGWKKES